MLLKADGELIATNTEIARSFCAKSRGLMFRKSIPDDYALLFVFSRPTKVSLHMVFVPFPIDVLLLNRDMRIIGMHSLNAWTGFLNSRLEVSYVVELPYGSVFRHNLKAGQQLSLDDST